MIIFVDINLVVNLDLSFTFTAANATQIDMGE